VTKNASEDNVALVHRYHEAFTSFDPDVYGPFLSDDPVYHAAMTMRRGAAAYHQNTGSGRVLYPFGALGSAERRTVGEGSWVASLIPNGIAERIHHVLVSNGQTVATLVTMRAVTNKGIDYTNLYGMFFDVHQGRIATMIEVLDGRVAAEAFDLTAIG